LIKSSCPRIAARRTASLRSPTLKRDEIVAIVRNGFHASLMDASAKDAALAEVDGVLANHA
jgi:hypothetical protein